jgi:hypothetical protein
MEQIGWSLIDGSGAEVRYWGDTLGVCTGIPNIIQLPNGGRVHDPKPGSIQDWWLVERHAQRGPSNIVWDGSRVVVSMPATPSDVRNEAQRRIIALTGASSFNECVVKQLNALTRATELANKKASGLSLSAPEEAEAAALQALADSIKGIRAKSNAMEVNPPADYANDSRWS